MLISEKINQAFNQQIGHELGNSVQYLAIATHFEKESLFGLAKIYYTQADEERDHAMKFVKFVLDAGGQGRHSRDSRAPELIAIRRSQAAQLALDAEMATTRQIYELVDLATEEKNYIALNFLQWFVSEQLEEVSSAEARLTVIRRAGPSVLMVEAYLAHETK